MSCFPHLSFFYFVGYNCVNKIMETISVKSTLTFLLLLFFCPAYGVIYIYDIFSAKAIVSPLRLAICGDVLFAVRRQTDCSAKVEVSLNYFFFLFYFFFSFFPPLSYSCLFAFS